MISFDFGFIYIVLGYYIFLLVPLLFYCDLVIWFTIQHKLTALCFFFYSIFFTFKLMVGVGMCKSSFGRRIVSIYFWRWI